jgi:hypothetical protein
MSHACTTRQGEPLVLCELAVTVPDPQLARTFLDGTYEPEDGGWLELHALSEERILRADSSLRVTG